MYLHGFVQPQIMEYDTLTSEDRWNEYADVILANPPFMTPKGGIKPHKKFSVQSNRSEVLFVDYIAEHLTPTGRAAVIVPEGIIFQGATAYKALRKMLVDNHLYAVVSLPAGIFNPYSGVKTSILLLDRQLAKKTDSILFVKIENDGFGLGAQRREIEKNDLPDAENVIKDYVTAIRNGKPESFIDEEKPCGALLIKKRKLAENEEYNLTADRYRIVIGKPKQKYPEIILADLVDIITPPKKLQTSEYLTLGENAIIDQSQDYIAGYTNDEDAVIIPTTPYIIFGDHTCAIKYIDFPFAQGADGIKILSPHEEIVPKYFYYFLKNNPIESDGYKRHFSKLKELKIPLPPLEVQRELVAEIEGYQKLIDGCRQVVDSWKPQFDIDPEWPMVKLGEYISINNGYVLTEFSNEGSIACIKVSDMNLEENQNHIVTSSHWILETDKKQLPLNSIVFPKRGAAIATNKKRLTKIPCLIDNNCMGITVLDENILSSDYLFTFMQGFNLSTISNSAGIALINNPDISGVDIPLPAIRNQQEIVTSIEAERKVIDGCRELLKVYEEKIKRVIDRVWEE